MYRPQDHAAAVLNWTEVSEKLLREVAALRGDVALLVNIHLKGQQAEAADRPTRQKLCWCWRCAPGRTGDSGEEEDRHK